jgi:hypothetical protein
MREKLTTKIFIERCSKKHDNFYDYSKSNYIDSKTKVIITCPIHNDFLQISEKHWNGHGCPECGKIKTINKLTNTQEQFLEKANFTHNSLYSYSKTNYTNSKEKVIITCKIHGDFKQSAQSHLNGQGCSECGRIRSIKASTKTHEQFIEKAKLVHNNTFDYTKTKYVHSDKKIIITCKIHGDFEQVAYNHTSGQGCPRCGKLSAAKTHCYDTDIFIDKSNKEHDFLYDYSKTNYINSNTKVTIICKEHGDFEQKPDGHLLGRGCSQCGNESHWKRSDYIKKANSRICTFYTIRCFNEDEEFYKIGITMNSVKERYRQTARMPYNYEVISEVYGEASLIWDLELAEKKRLKSFNYQPQIVFGGSKRECFTQYKK